MGIGIRNSAYASPWEKRERGRSPKSQTRKEPIFLLTAFMSHIIASKEPERLTRWTNRMN
jgi:hypothetical protein